jgi:PKD repeat protein/glucose/arabinose dehydrogenase
LLIILMLLVGIVPASAMALPPGFGEADVVAGSLDLDGPTAVAYAPDGRTFLTEKSGRLLVVAPGGDTATTLLDLSDKVNEFSDRGLLGIAADTDFESNGYLYLLYTLELNPLDPDSDEPMVSRLTRVTVRPDNTLALPAGSSDPETVILGKDSSEPCPEPDNTLDCITADYYWHTIGTVRSDPTDGTLWLGNGDSHGFGVDELSWRTYDPNSFAGKIIHIDREGRGLPNHPFCPDDTNLDHVCTKIYATGFRNPFRFHLRPGKGPVVGDVGFESKEEVDFVEPGRNYGWPCYEGTDKPASRSSDPVCQDLYAKEGTPQAAAPPSWEYDHGEGAAVAVGPVYDGLSYPAHFRGDLFVGDFVQGWIKRLEIGEDDRVTGVHDFSSEWFAGVDLEMHPSGDLSYVRFGFPGSPASVSRYTYSGSMNSPPDVEARAEPDTGAPPLLVQFTGSGSSDPDGDDLTFHWDFGDGSPDSEEADPAHTYTSEGTYTARVTVTDSEGSDSSDTVRITVTENSAPTAVIESPADESLYRDGAPVTLTGGGSDPEDGELIGDSLHWSVLLHHNTHVHTLTADDGEETSFTPLRDHDADSFYEIRLTATDSGGRESTHTIELRPETSDLELSSSPPGAPLAYEDVQAPAPFSRDAAVGYRPRLTAPDTFQRGGRTYRFVAWSDGGTRTHQIEVPEGSPQYTATYRRDDVETLVFEPVADTYVEDQSPDQGFGDALQVRVVNAPVHREAFLKFDVEGLGGRDVVGARLVARQLEENGAAFGGSVHAVDSTSWGEGITWNSRPELGTALASFGAAVSLRRYEVDLGASAVTEDGLLSLGMSSPEEDGSGWGSRESDSPAQLIVEVESHACSDGEDDDGDGVADFPADLGCMSPMDGDENQAPAAAIDATPVTGDAPLQVAYGAAGSVDPEADELSYDWDFGDGSAGSTEPAVLHLYATPGTYTATLTVTDEHGGSASDSVQIAVASAVHGGTPTPSTVVPQPSFEGVRIRGGGVRLSRDAAPIRLACSPTAVGQCTGTLQLVTRLQAGRRAARTAVGLGTVRFSIRSGKSARVRVKVSPRGRRLLARHGRLTTSGQAIAHDDLLRKRSTRASLVLMRPAPSRRPWR